MAPKFTKLCLNRNRLITYGYNDDSDRPHAAAYGKVNNALHTVLHDADYDQLIARKKKFQAALTTPFDYYDAQYNKTASIRTVDYGQDLERIFNWMHQRHLVSFLEA